MPHADFAVVRNPIAAITGVAVLRRRAFDIDIRDKPLHLCSDVTSATRRKAAYEPPLWVDGMHVGARVDDRHWITMYRQAIRAATRPGLTRGPVAAGGKILEPKWDGGGDEP